MSALSLRTGPRLALKWKTEKNTAIKESVPNNSPKGFVSSTNGNPTQLSYHLNSSHSKLINRDDDDVDYANEVADTFNEDFHSLTPPVSRNGHYSVRSRSSTPLRLNTSLKGPCHARTRMGTPCKLTSLPGRDYCYRHQAGDSVMG